MKKKMKIFLILVSALIVQAFCIFNYCFYVTEHHYKRNGNKVTEETTAVVTYKGKIVRKVEITYTYNVN